MNLSNLEIPIAKAIDRARGADPTLNLRQLSELTKRTAFKVTSVGELIGREVAQRLGVPFAAVDVSLAPTANVGNSRGRSKWLTGGGR
jgi:uncharacterized protein (UPF0210 family)